ncbi:enoyl-CoA hydratase/isomerase family protein [Diaphorobacter sp. HDW4A]|uniref:enoyl-CoA hydratase/isomerase family protein n=1 Tax=Diaphorobacter sp. HDW4A TaxID=2714924 RepID=UPI00140B5048|nr:enoyl-CoA hydratase/isomerase family protein [Diaphorobacter sp. HDW4A]QIL79974.1 enoyl-CoA hydratase/isomerase family protein [Diaphorobacter sp. HDW4A]
MDTLTELPALPVLREKRTSGSTWITINRAHKHNALARPVLQMLADAVREAAADTTTRYIVLCGTGDRYFAAGGDLKDLASVRDEASVRTMMDEACGALDAIRLCPVPVLAYLNGDAIGGGAELALACDMRLQAANARIGYIQARLAITSAWGGGPDLFQLLGTSRAMRMMCRGELIDAAQALQWGLCDAVITDGASGEDMNAFLKPMDRVSPQVLRGIKAQAIAARRENTWAAHRRVEQRHLMHTWLHDDHWAASENILTKGST